MILIAYDGSTGARAAIAQAGHLMPGHEATIVCVSRSGEKEIAAEVAAEGEALAHEAGIDALSSGVHPEGSVAEAILAEAARLGADAVVIGSRGGPGARSGMLGGVGLGLMQLADRPVLVVPEPRPAGSGGAHFM